MAVVYCFVKIEMGPDKDSDVSDMLNIILFSLDNIG